PTWKFAAVPDSDHAPPTSALPQPFVTLRAKLSVANGVSARGAGAAVAPGAVAATPVPNAAATSRLTIQRRTQRTSRWWRAGPGFCHGRWRSGRVVRAIRARTVTSLGLEGYWFGVEPVSLAVLAAASRSASASS